MNMNDEQQRLVTDNMKLVHFVVNKYYPTFNGNEDVSQVGMVGLCKAALAWNPEKTTFTTCACNYIRCGEYMVIVMVNGHSYRAGAYTHAPDIL